jgi:hypothetical protein
MKLKSKKPKRERALDLKPSSSILSIFSGKRGLGSQMDVEEIAQKLSMNDLRPLAKKYGIPTRCVKKIDIVKALPKEALAELEAGKPSLKPKKSAKKPAK